MTVTSSDRSRSGMYNVENEDSGHVSGNILGGNSTMISPEPSIIRFKTSLGPADASDNSVLIRTNTMGKSQMHSGSQISASDKTVKEVILPAYSKVFLFGQVKQNARKSVRKRVVS